MEHHHSVDMLMDINLSIRSALSRQERVEGTKLLKSTSRCTRFIRLAQKVFQVRGSSYWVPDSSYLSGCTFGSTIVCIGWVSIVRLLKYEHQHPPINTLLSRRLEHKANFEAHDQACRLIPLAGPAGKS